MSSRLQGLHRTCMHKPYSLTCDEYDQLLARSAGCCEICRVRIPGSAIGRRTLQIDHDHTLGHRYVRGMLCPRCNMLMFRVDAGLAEATDAMREYLANSWYLVHGVRARGQRGTTPRQPVVRS